MISVNVERVLIVIPALKHVGGVSNFYQNLKSHLPLHEVEYFEYLSSRDGVGVFSIIRNYLNFIIRLFKRDVRIVCLNPSMGRYALLRDGVYSILAKILGKKTVVFFHGWNPNTVGSIENRWLFLFKTIYFRASSIIVLSPEYRQKLVNWGYSRPVYISTTHVPEGHLALKDLSVYLLNDTFQEFKILFLSRVERQKGIAEALEAFNVLRKKYPFVSMDCVGGGNELAYWKNYAELNGIPAVFHGQVYGEEKLKFYINSDCYIFPSYSEGMPTSVLEAMAVGLPVVTHAVGGLKYMFQNGVMGFMIDNLNAVSYAEATEKLIENRSLLVSIGKYNSNYVRMHSTSKIVAQQMMNIFSLV